MSSRLSILLLLLWLPGAGFAEASDAELAACAACHGEDGLGREALAAPRLAGQHASYLADQLRAYRSGARGAHPEDFAGATMRAASVDLDDARIDALARHYAALGPSGVEADAAAEDPAGRAPGAALYAAHCATCHGPDAEGRGSVHAPALAILSPGYLARQMQAYREGWRGAATSGTTRARFMRSMAALLADDAEVDAVLEHISGLDVRSPPAP